MYGRLLSKNEVDEEWSKVQQVLNSKTPNRIKLQIFNDLLHKYKAQKLNPVQTIPQNNAAVSNFSRSFSTTETQTDTSEEVSDKTPEEHKPEQIAVLVEPKESKSDETIYEEAREKSENVTLPTKETFVENIPSTSTPVATSTPRSRARFRDLNLSQSSQNLYRLVKLDPEIFVDASGKIYKNDKWIKESNIEDVLDFLTSPSSNKAFPSGTNDVLKSIVKTTSTVPSGINNTIARSLLLKLIREKRLQNARDSKKWTTFKPH